MPKWSLWLNSRPPPLPRQQPPEYPREPLGHEESDGPEALDKGIVGVTQRPEEHAPVFQWRVCRVLVGTRRDWVPWHVKEQPAEVRPLDELVDGHEGAALGERAHDARGVQAQAQERCQKQTGHVVDGDRVRMAFCTFS